MDKRPLWFGAICLFCDSCVAGGNFDTGRVLPRHESALILGLEVGAGFGESFLGRPLAGAATAPRLQMVVSYSRGMGHDLQFSTTARFLCPLFGWDYWDTFVPHLELGYATAVPTSLVGNTASAGGAFYWKVSKRRGEKELKMFGGPHLDNLVGVKLKLTNGALDEQGFGVYVSPEYRIEFVSGAAIPSGISQSVGLTVGTRFRPYEGDEEKANYLQGFGLISWDRLAVSQRVLLGYGFEPRKTREQSQPQ